MKNITLHHTGRSWPVTLLIVLVALTAGGMDAVASDDVAVDALAPGDAIDLRFWKEPALDGEFPIDERGIAVLPLLGEFQAVGISPDQVRRDILSRYHVELANQEVRVTPLRRIPILGAVKNPGLYRIDATIRVNDALALAGGQTVDGKHDEVILLRDTERIRIPLDRQLPGPGTLKSGDQLFVHQRNWFVRNSLFLVTASVSAMAIIYAATL